MSVGVFFIPWLETASRRQKWLIGVSGGADSVALLWILHGAGFRRLVVCHLNHGLRGRSAAGDARFVAQLASQLGYECEVASADVRGRMKERNESMETAARGERLTFFTRMARKHRCRRVILAHHADDQAETVLWNLMRGSHGLRGMGGAREVKAEGLSVELVRPLLGIRRQELTAWLIQQGRKWREDGSNQEPVAVRNRLRHEVMPLLREITGRDPVWNLCRLADDGHEIDAWMMGVVRDARVMDSQGRIHLGVLSALAPVLQRKAVAEFLRTHGIGGVSRALLDAALGLLDRSGPAAVNLPGGGRLRRSAGRLWLER
jgi:tRNA(Ile)-lysidine synthase